MKLTKFANLLVIALALTVAASGCRKKPVGVTKLPSPYTKNVKDQGPGAGLPGTGLPDGGRTPSDALPRDTNLNPDLTGGHPLGPGHPGWPQDRTILKADTIYFDFDSSVIKASEKPKVASVAEYLKANAANAVLIEGNCDERGTEEYNRALGDRRAVAVREELISLGIAMDRVDIKTWGKDNPDNDPGHDEAAWRKNRRDDFVVLTPPK